MLKKIVIYIFILVNAGCAFTVHDVSVDYSYKGETKPELVGISMLVGDISDSRGIENPRMIMHMQNLYGDTTSGGWQAEKPLSEIVKEALVDGLSKAGANIAPPSNIVLEGELVSFDYQTIMGAWEGSYKGKITVKLQLTNQNTSKIIWRDTFVGSGEVKAGEGAVGLMTESLDQLISSLLSDDYFQQQIKEI